MVIRFVSSLSAEEEATLARTVMKAASGMLDLWPIAYTLRVETGTGDVYQHSRPAEAAPVAQAQPVGPRRISES